ncbi:pre-rRNA-processing protein TSR1, partial [Trifolium pratense]
MNIGDSSPSGILHVILKIQKHVLAKALELDEEGREDCIPVGSYARLHIKEVPSAAASKLCTLAKTAPVTACGLLKHESKLSVLHFSYPQRVSKRKASVRHMFYNPEDVKWFKPVEIYTKRGLRGRIKEPVGTH